MPDQSIRRENSQSPQPTSTTRRTRPLRRNRSSVLRYSTVESGREPGPEPSPHPPRLYTAANTRACSPSVPLTLIGIKLNQLSRGSKERNGTVGMVVHVVGREDHPEHLVLSDSSCFFHTFDQQAVLVRIAPAKNLLPAS